ncbi:multisubunit potassium/proton antiporter PhaE subunit [Palleronia aestuarii]|uniref:Multisubunit potassium/proton antiporter PhaE subunit n=1 Tax=Palleronia aestuarii TaxID=568105 RepID=A0A2W7MY42_9RHOB|nr:Na+/H+ antiporter subunit E [Palleronia aestuarii]PZX12928.1 multisubunit potassium/proton antiporter PhaE subunit [Palleronia aestuarii]
MTRHIFKRLLPHPMLTLLLVVVWCLLNNTIGPGAIVFGAILGLVIPAVTAPYWPDRPSVPQPWGMLVYIFIVLWDIIVANVVVARIILFKSNADMKSAWVRIPLDLRKPEAITILAGTITLTPGTVSADLSSDGTELLVHALHAPDPDAVRDEIKSRYERRLKELFE